MMIEILESVEQQSAGSPTGKAVAEMGCIVTPDHAGIARQRALLKHDREHCHLILCHSPSSYRIRELFEARHS